LDGGRSSENVIAGDGRDWPCVPALLGFLTAYGAKGILAGVRAAPSPLQKAKIVASIYLLQWLEFMLVFLAERAGKISTNS